MMSTQSERRFKCPVGLEEITITFLDPDERILTRRRVPDGRYVLAPRRETGYPKILVSCPSLRTPHLADLPTALKESMIKKGKWWCEKMRVVCPDEQIISSLLEA